MNLLKSTGTFGFFTILSRLLGYLRDILIAVFLGTGVLADAFFVAFRIPNTFRRLFSEGTFNAAFVPSYTSEMVKGKKQSDKFANDIFNFLFLSLFFLVLVVQIFMPVFVSIIAPGFVGDFEKYSWDKLFDARLGGADKVKLYSDAIENAIPEDIWDHFIGVLGEGISAIPIDGMWFGGLTQLCGTHGYWFVTSNDFELAEKELEN